jgi:hypothetical protein
MLPSMSIEQPVFFPAKELSKDDVGTTLDNLIPLQQRGETALPLNHPLRRYGRQIIEFLFNKTRLYEPRSEADARAISTSVIVGQGVYQDYSALANPRHALPEWAVKSSSYEVRNLLSRSAESVSLKEIVHDFQSSLPLSSDLHTQIGKKMEVPLVDCFLVGASLAHRLELGARCLAIMGREHSIDNL